MGEDIERIRKEIYEKETKYARLNKKFKVKDVEHMGTIELTEQVNSVDTKIVKDVFKAIEQMEDGTIVENYYDEQGNFIAGRDQEGRMCFDQKGTYKDTDLLEQIEELREKDEQVEEIAKHTGLKKEKIISILEIDLDQQIKKDNKQNKEINSREVTDKEKNEPQKISKKEIKNAGITSKNEIDTNNVIDAKGTTLGSELNMKEYKKILVVYSYKLSQVTNENGEKGKNNRLQFSLIGQKEDGTYETIPESKLKIYAGSNNEVVEINNKENVKSEREENIFEVPGTNKRMVISQKTTAENPYGRPQVFLANNTINNDGNVAQKVQDTHDGVQRQDIEVRELFNRNKGINQISKMRDEAKETEQYLGEPVKLGDADGSNKTGTLDNIDETSEEDMKKIIEKIKEENPKIAEVYTDREIYEELIKNAKENGKNESFNETINRTIENLKAYAEHVPTHTLERDNN